MPNDADKAAIVGQWQTGDLVGVQSKLRQLLDREPEDAEAWQWLSRVILGQGRNDAALATLEEGFAACNTAELADDIGAWHIRARDPDTARAWLKRADGLAATPSTARSYQYALCEWLAGNYQAAVDRFAAVAAIEPENARYAMRHARALASLGLAEETASILRSFQGGNLPAAGHSLLAMCEFDLSGTESALAIVENGRKSHPADPLLANLLATFYAMRGNNADIPSPVLDLCRSNPQAQACLESVLYACSRRPLPVFHGLATAVLDHGIDASSGNGLVLEFGVFRGLSLSQIAKRVEGPVHGFDSFEGLPEAWSLGEKAGSYSAQGVLPSVPDTVSLHVGWFEHTAPAFFAEHDEPIRLLHVDCDIYSSTATVLKHAAAFLVPGSVVVFDEYAGYPGYKDHEFRAWQEFIHAQSIRYEYLAFNLNAKKAAVRITG